MNQEETIEKSIKDSRAGLDLVFVFFCVLGHSLNDCANHLLGFNARVFCQIAFYITFVSSYLMPAPKFLEEEKEISARFERAASSVCFFYGAMIMLLSMAFKTNFAVPVGFMYLFVSVHLFHKTYLKENKTTKTE